MFGNPSKPSDVHEQNLHGETSSSGVLALRTCEEDGDERDCLDALFSLVERGVIWTKFPESSIVDFLSLQIVTFLKQI